MDQRDGGGRAGADGLVELRVHGVSATGPDDLLDRPHVQQVAGDHRGGFYRPRPEDHEGGEARGVTLEAYRWNNLPAGNAVRTLSTEAVRHLADHLRVADSRHQSAM
jgi:hypothetical protein